MTITLDIGPEIEAELAAMARAQGVSAEQYARQVLEKALVSAGSHKPLSARIREIWADIPDEVRAGLPTDGASQHDHYIYGTPKRTSELSFCRHLPLDCVDKSGANRRPHQRSAEGFRALFRSHGVITTPRPARSLSIAATHASISGVCALRFHLSRVPAGICSSRALAASSDLA